MCSGKFCSCSAMEFSLPFYVVSLVSPNPLSSICHTFLPVFIRKVVELDLHGCRVSTAVSCLRRQPGPGEGLECCFRRAASKPVSPSQEFLSKETEGVTGSPHFIPCPVRIGNLKT